MTRFAYEAIPLSGGRALVTGREEARDERALRESLRERGLLAVDVRPEHLADALRSRLRRERCGGADRVWFFQTLHALLDSGVPLEEALGTVAEIAPRESVRSAAGDARDALRKGVPLADALERGGGLVGAREVALLRAGGESGRLTHVVGLIAGNLARTAAIRRALVGKLVYPAILMATCVGVVWFLAAFVIPRFAETLESLGGELPAATVVTLHAADWLIVGIPVLAVLGAAGWWNRARLVPEGVRLRLHERVLGVPMVGPLIWHAQAASVTDVLATMLEGGADVLAALEQARGVASSPVLRGRLERVRLGVREGGDVGELLARERVLPPMIAAVVRIGVRSGELVPALKRAAAMCLDEQERLGQRLMTLVQPAIVLFIAAVVGWVVVSLILGISAMNEVGS